MNKKFEGLQRVFAGVENGIVDPILSAAVSAYALLVTITTPDMDEDDDTVEVLNESVRATNAYGNVSKKANSDAYNAVKLAYEASKNAYNEAYMEYLTTDYVDLIKEDPREYAKFIRNVSDSMQNKDDNTNEDRFNEFMKIIFDGSDDSPKLRKLNDIDRKGYIQYITPNKDSSIPRPPKKTLKNTMMKDSDKEIMELFKTRRGLLKCPDSVEKGIYDCSFSRDIYDYNATFNFNTKEYSIQCLTPEFKSRLGSIAVLADIIKLIADDELLVEDRCIGLGTWELIKIEILSDTTFVED